MEFAYKAKSFLVLLPFKPEALAVGTKFTLRYGKKPLLSRPAWQRWSPPGLVTTRTQVGWCHFPRGRDKARSVSAVLKAEGIFHPPRLTPVPPLPCLPLGRRRQTQAMWGDDWIRGFFLQLQQGLDGKFHLDFPSHMAATNRMWLASTWHVAGANWDVLGV